MADAVVVGVLGTADGAEVGTKSVCGGVVTEFVAPAATRVLPGVGTGLDPDVPPNTEPKSITGSMRRKWKSFCAGGILGWLTIRSAS